METFLYAFAGAVVALVVLGFLAWTWLKHRLECLGQAICALAQPVPPFRITLDPAEESDWNDFAAVESASAGFQALGYQSAGDYRVNEMDGVFVRALWHPEHVFAAIWDQNGVGVYADLVRSFADGRQLTVSCAPRTGADRPEFARRVLVEMSLADEQTARILHQNMQSESQGGTPMLSSAGSFPALLIEAYRREMDWRIERGGVTVDEVRHVAAVAGQERPDDRAVELIRTLWRNAIEMFVSGEVLESFLASNPMPASDWESRRDHVRAVHEHCDRAERIEELAWHMIEGSHDEGDEQAEQRAFEQAKSRLESLLEAPSFCQAFAAAQSLLPEKRRYERIGSVQQPWTADLYLEPEDPDGC